MIKKQIYNLEFTEEELQMIYMVFSKLENKCFAKWRSMWPDDGESGEYKGPCGQAAGVKRPERIIERYHRTVSRFK